MLTFDDNLDKWTKHQRKSAHTQPEHNSEYFSVRSHDLYRFLLSVTTCITFCFHWFHSFLFALFCHRHSLTSKLSLCFQIFFVFLGMILSLVFVHIGCRSLLHLLLFLDFPWFPSLPLTYRSHMIFFLAFSFVQICSHSMCFVYVCVCWSMVSLLLNMVTNIHLS